MDLSKIAEILVLIADLQAKLADVEVFVAAEKQLSYEKGFADGVASVPVVPPSDKLYSQEELDAKLAEALLPLNDKIVELEKKIEELTLAVDAAKVEAVALFKAELAAKYEELQVAETAAEVGFGELLK